MPAYKYECLDCGTKDLRIAGADDHVAACAPCGGLMLRTDEDLFGPYFTEILPPAPITSTGFLKS